MRLLLLAFILFLALTLGNAFWLQREKSSAVVQRSADYYWNAFAWREVGALAITVVLFGTMVVLRGTTARR